MITFYNHACFSVTHENVNLLCDPYIQGTAFHHGWDLITGDIDYTLDMATVTHIWFSHEHPDHFSPAFLKAIPEEQRKRITILYQKTLDGRVKGFCKKFGFQFQEIADGETLSLADDVSIQVGVVPFYDSWAVIRAGGKTIVNTNDCILETPERITDIAKYVDRCDILFTQFSYANWMDGKETDEGRKKLAEEKLRRVAIQCNALQPDYVVPFASFVRFCHEENAYMNDAINMPHTTLEFMENECTGTPILLMPNKQWDGENAVDNAASLNYWEAAYHAAMERELITAKESISFDILQQKSEKMLTRARKKNSSFVLSSMARMGLLPAIDFHVSDLEKTLRFDWRAGLSIAEAGCEPMVTLHSESLAFIFDFDFGIDTVNVNARFVASRETRKKMIRCFAPLALNNTGRTLSLGGLRAFLDKQFLLQGLRTVGLYRPKSPHWESKEAA